MRLDFQLYNEANGFSLHAADWNGSDRKRVAGDLLAAVMSGKVIPLQLYSDNSLNVRVVDEELTSHEESEWVGCVRGSLDLSSSPLAIEAGLDPRHDDSSLSAQRSLLCIDVPRGMYDVSIYTQLPSVNGPACLDSAGDREPIGSWFRQTRPATRLPGWMQLLLAESETEDPAWDEHWEAFLESKEYSTLLERNSRCVDFLIQLRPAESAEGAMITTDDGWFAATTGARKPAACPLGIPFSE